MPSLKMPKNTSTRRLHNTELKRLAAILRTAPTSLDSSSTKALKKAIKHLHSLLQHSLLSTSSTLCSLHKGLDHHLGNEIWSWIRHEFSAIGQFIYPLIINNMLSADQELAIRQLEPVLQMFRRDYKLDLSAPHGREPLDYGGKWAYQVDRCSACMLARIGSDDEVLRALYAGMIGRFPVHKLVGRKVALSVSSLDGVKSKRVRFVRYWIKAAGGGGDNLLSEAAELGLNFRKLYQAWKDAQPRRVSLYSNQLANTATAQDPFRDSQRASVSVTVPGPRYQQSNPFRDPTTQHAPSRADSLHAPSPSRADSRAHAFMPSRSHLHPYNFSDSDTVLPNDSISQVAVPAPLRIIKSNPQPQPRLPSSSPSAISSYDGNAKYKDWQAMRDPFEYEASVLRAPRRESMYFGGGEVGGEGLDPFDDVDEEVVEEEEDEFEVEEVQGRRMSQASTRWEELY